MLISEIVFRVMLGRLLSIKDMMGLITLLAYLRQASFTPRLLSKDASGTQGMRYDRQTWMRPWIGITDGKRVFPITFFECWLGCVGFMGAVY